MNKRPYQKPTTTVYRAYRSYVGNPGCGCGCKGAYSAKPFSVRNVLRQIVGHPALTLDLPDGLYPTDLILSAEEHDGDFTLTSTPRFRWVYVRLAAADTKEA